MQRSSTSLSKWIAAQDAVKIEVDAKREVRFFNLQQLFHMPNRESTMTTIVRSPVRILAIILVLVFTTEVAVMLLLPHMLSVKLSDTVEAFIDAILLTLVCAPVLWFVIVAAKRAEEERVMMARETEALRTQQMTTLAELATGVAHEIRNPLTSIKMLIQVNRAKFADKGLPTDDLELVEHEIRRMERSVTSLLEYARPERSEPLTFTIQKVIRNTVQLIDARCDSQHVELVVEVSDSPIQITGDPAQIQQLLLNLTLNALDAMPDGGKLNVIACEVDGDCEIRVTDTGTGIEAAVESRLFSPFVTTKEAGVGLGLGICRRIAEQHQGTLTGANRATRGAEFRLTLPLGHSESSPGNEVPSQEKTQVPEAETTCKPC